MIEDQTSQSKPVIHLLEDSSAKRPRSKVDSMAGLLSRWLPILFFIIILGSPFFTFAKNYPNGTLIRAKGDIKVYLIQGHKKSWIKSPQEFNALKFNWQKVKVISKEEVVAIEEEIVLSVTPIPTPSSLAPSPSSGPSFLRSPVASTTPVPAKINLNFPPPDFIKADWLISSLTSNYGRIGQKITFKYSDKLTDRIENFRLYEKKPGAPYFVRIAEFEQLLSTSCEDIDIDGEWMITEAGKCGYWAIQRIIPPGGRGTTAYLPAAAYSEGEYRYYVVAVDKDGLETEPSSKARLIFLTTVGIFSPVDNQKTSEVYPTFKWSIAGGWPAGSTVDYLILISDDPNAQNPFWAKTFKVSAGKSEQSFTYDGFGLNPASKYKVYIYGHYRQSEHDPDYISIPLTVPEFWIKTTGQRVSWWNFLKALIFPPFKVKP